MIPSAFYSFHLISFTRISRGPSHHKKWILKQQVYEYHSASQSTARKSAANVRTPSVTSSEPLPKRPENPSEATAVVAGRVHLGPSRDQLLNHGGVASVSRPMQRRLASGVEDATRTAGTAAAAVEKQSVYSHGMFLRVVGQKTVDRS